MISDEVRNSIWQDMLEVNRCVRYYNDLRNKLLKRDTRTRNATFFAGLFSVLAVIATITSGLPFPLNLTDYIESQFRSTTALISLFGVVACFVLSDWRSREEFNYQAKIAAFIAVNLGPLSNQYSKLWGELNLDDFGMNDSEVLERRGRLLKRLTEITKIGIEERLSDDGELIEQSTKDAYLELANRYAVK